MRRLPVRSLAKFKNKNVLAIILVVLTMMTLGASASADAIAKTFASDKPISPGYVVALTKSDDQKVELAKSNELNRIYGVVINPSDSPVTLQSGNGQVVVSTNGSYVVFVSLSGGAIRAGDYLSVSSTPGVAAKASATQDYIVGKALDNFDGSKGVLSGSGTDAVTKIAVQVSPGKNPLAKSEPSVPGPLLKLANSLAGKQVSAQRIYTALAIFLISFIVAASLIYVGVRTSMISIGRNPLSKHSIFRGLAQVIVAASLVFAGGLIGVYLLIRA